MKNRQCSRCRIYYPLSEYRNNTGLCRTCRNDRTNAWYHKNKGRAQDKAAKIRWLLQRIKESEQNPTELLKRAYAEVKNGNVFQFRDGILSSEQCLTDDELNNIGDA